VSVLPNILGGVVYVPAPASGSRTVLVVPRLVVVLGAGAAPAVLSRVWAEMTSTTSSFERVVQSIPSIGSEGLSSFAVAALENDDSTAAVVSIVARGDSIVDVHTTGSSPRRFSSQGLQPWHLASFSSVTGLRFGSADTPDALGDELTVSGSELPLVLGAASAASVTWSLDERSTVVDPSAARHTIVGPSTGADSSESEITLDKLPQRRRSRHGGPPETPPAPEPRPQRARPLRVRIGAQAPFELHVPVYIGRRPRGSRQLPGDQVILIEVPSPTREVSASHLHIVQQGERVVVTDLKSTNGTAVTPPGAPRIKLSQGDSIVLPPYSRIEIGDGNVIEILPGAD
jgi:hypothetical protein